MRNILFLSGIILLLFISCDEAYDEPETIPDAIIFSNLNAPISKHTVRYYSIQDHGVCRANIPNPGDSVTTINLDVNNDSTADFTIRLSHSYWEPTQYCGHCSIYSYDINIRGNSSSDSIAVAPDEPWVARYYGETDTISFDNDWGSELILSMKGGCVRPTFSIEDEYIGFKHNNLLGWIKLKPQENNGILVENFAINLSPNKTIRAGQIK
ncbi:MAG: hypothetical protein K9H26_16365 [Prolixibacteraceae bacterium]|nr:hypothetical protein [Prolixibacteraceae bacterium]